MKINELRKLDLEGLKAKKLELEKLYLSCHRGVHPKVQIGNRKNIQKDLARVLTLIKEKGK